MAAAELAVAEHRGAPTDINITFAALGSEATNQQISVDGLLREFYLVAAHDTCDGTLWRPELDWPIFRADA